MQLGLDGDGAVLAVIDDRLDAPIKLKDVNLNGKILFFDFVVTDGDNDKFQMELTEGNSARLQWIGLPNGMLGIGFALLNAPTFSLALLASGLYGLGYGFATPGTNLWVAESYGDRRASALNVANLAWGVGAISSSPLAMLTVRKAQVTTFLYVVAIICLALAASLLRMPFGKAPHHEDAANSARDGKTPGLGLAVALGILFYVYVGTENTVSFWAPTHAQRAAAWSGNTWTLAPMAS